MNENNRISYYAVIPATVLFNERLKANEAYQERIDWQAIRC